MSSRTATTAHGWIAYSGATNLTEPGSESDGLSRLDPSVADALDAVLFFGGHNSFVGAGEKDDAVRGLRAILATGQQPDPYDVEQYACASGKTDVAGARRLRDFYTKILAGKQLRDSRGRSI